MLEAVGFRWRLAPAWSGAAKGDGPAKRTASKDERGEESSGENGSDAVDDGGNEEEVEDKTNHDNCGEDEAELDGFFS